MSLRTEKHTELNHATMALARALRQPGDPTVPEIQDRVLTARLKYQIAKVLEGAKRPLPEDMRNDVCAFLAEAAASVVAK